MQLYPPPSPHHQYTRTHRHTSLTCSPKRGGGCSLITEDPSLVPRPHPLTRKGVWWPLSDFLVVPSQQSWYWTTQWSCTTSCNHVLDRPRHLFVVSCPDPTLAPVMLLKSHDQWHFADLAQPRNRSMVTRPLPSWEGGVWARDYEDPRKMASMLCYSLHYINSSNHTFIVVWLALMWLNTAIWLVPHWATNCCKQSTSLFVEPGVWPARLCPHVNFTFLSLCDNCATCRLLGVHGVSFVPLSDATGTSQLVCDFKVLYHHDRSLIPTHTQLSVTCGMESWARTWDWGYQIWA